MGLMSYKGWFRALKYRSIVMFSWNELPYKGRKSCSRVVKTIELKIEPMGLNTQRDFMEISSGRIVGKFSLNVSFGVKGSCLWCRIYVIWGWQKWMRIIICIH